MAVNMQGSWTISVKSVEPGEPKQRFVIANAATGNGTYAGATSTPPVHVTGDHWSITVQMDRGSGFVDSADQLQFPSVVGSNYQFSILSNYPANDPLYDDLVLLCETPVNTSDFIVYGNASYYDDDRCLVNPCRRTHIVIDSALGLAAALKNPALRKLIERHYPERVKVKFPPGPWPPDPGPYRPVVLPLVDESPIPLRQAQLLSSLEADTQAPRMQVMRNHVANTGASLSTGIDRVAIGSLIDRWYGRCDTGPLAGVALRFEQYDRSSAELAGGAYTGTGPREQLGACATDQHGNFIFRFSRTPAEYGEEGAVDVAPGESFAVQVMPDLIVSLLDFAPAGVRCYESAPYWNIPYLKRINVCVPRSCVGRLPTACQGHRAIQAIGNINIGDVKTGYVAPVGAPPGYGPRVGFTNSLGSEGRITSRDTSTTSVPQARCAAWFSSLDLFGCFLDQPNVKYYTIRWRPHVAYPATQADWQLFMEEYRHPMNAKIGLPGYTGDLVGPLPGTKLAIDGGAKVFAPAYLNIEADPAWRLAHRDRKAVITSSRYTPVSGFGSVDFRIEGYDSSGNKVAAADDTITLYIDNTNPVYDIASVTMDDPVTGTTEMGGDCALFNLNGEANTPLTVRFRANQLQGFLDRFDLTVRKGNIGGFGITDLGPGLLTAQYAHGDDLACSSLEGTFDDLAADGSGYVVADIRASGAGWLDPGQPFCTFAVQLGCSTRVTNGYNQAVYGYGTIEYLLGIQAS